jgi:acetyl esterase/lipase
MSVIELTTFTVTRERTAALLAARPGMVEAFRADRRGFISAKLIRVAEDRWLDVVEWIDDTAWDESRAKGANRPEIAAFFDAIDTVVSSERGVRYDDAEDGSRAVRTVYYGPDSAQVGELYLPAGEGPFPVVVLLHGGFWTAAFDRRQLTGLADDLVAGGFAVWNAEFRRLGEPGGGWPGTFLDAAAAIDALDGMDPALDLDRVVVAGHSAGGHLAAWAAHRATLPPQAPGSAPKVGLVGAVSLAGVLDLVAADAAELGSELADPAAKPPAGAPAPVRPELPAGLPAGAGMVNMLLGGRFAEQPERYRWASPAQMESAGVPVLAVHGEDDEVVDASYSRAYGGAPAAEVVELPGTGHFDVINPAHPSWILARDWITARLSG